MRFLPVLTTLALTPISALSIESIEEPISERFLQNAEGGARCKTSTDIICKVQQNANDQNYSRDCNSNGGIGSQNFRRFDNLPNTCGERNLKLTYKMCNDNGDFQFYTNNANDLGRIRYKKPQTKYTFESDEMLLPAQIDQMKPSDLTMPKVCYEWTEFHVVDSCSNDPITFSIKLEGSVVDQDGAIISDFPDYNTGDHNCYSYSYDRFKYRTMPAPRIGDCTMTSTIACTYADDGLPCNYAGFETGCEQRNVIVQFDFCNQSEGQAELFEGLTIAKFKSDVQGIDNTGIMEPGDCRNFTSAIRSFNNCDDRRFRMSQKIEGKIVDSSPIAGQKDGPYCYAWAFEEIKLPKPTNARLRTECRVNNKNNGAPFPCDEMPEISRLDHCERELTYTYYISRIREDQSAVAVFPKITGEETFDGVRITLNEQDGNERRVARHIITKDLCSVEDVKNVAIAVVANDDGGGSASTPKYPHTFTPRVALLWQFETNYRVQCRVVKPGFTGTCEEYTSSRGPSCIVDVEFSAKLDNIGEFCRPIFTAESEYGVGNALEAIVIETSAPDENYCWLFCPGNNNEWLIKQSKTIDLCASDRPAKLGISLNGGLLKMASINY